MRYILLSKLREFLKENHPDILLSLESSEVITDYLNKKLDAVENLLHELLAEQRPNYIIEELCMNALTEDLGPSKFNFIKDVLEDEFLIEYHHLLRSGILRFEITNLIAACDHLFEAFEFTKGNEGDKNLRYTITGTIREYFEFSEKETSWIWPTMPIKN
jgi:hypothetical protein